MKEWIKGIFIAAGSFTASLFGGFSTGLQVLLICMAVDYLSGMVLAGVFRKSRKTETGCLESRAGFKGLIRKGMELAVVLVAAQIDRELGSHYVRDAACIGFMVNELISIIENAGLMGVPIPPVIRQAVELLTEKTEHTIHPEEGESV